MAENIGLDEGNFYLEMTYKRHRPGLDLNDLLPLLLRSISICVTNYYKQLVPILLAKIGAYIKI